MGYRWFRNSRTLLSSPLLMLLIFVIAWWRTAGGDSPRSRPGGNHGSGGSRGGGHHGSRVNFPEPSFQRRGHGHTRPCGYYRNAADRCRDG